MPSTTSLHTLEHPAWPSPYLQGAKRASAHGRRGKGVQAVVPVHWELVSLEKKSCEGDPNPSPDWHQGALSGFCPPAEAVKTPVDSGPSALSLSYQLCGQLPRVHQEGAGQEDCAVQLRPGVWGCSRGTRRRSAGSSSLWPEAQHHQDQVANTWGYEDTETLGGPRV